MFLREKSIRKYMQSGKRKKRMLFIGTAKKERYKVKIIFNSRTTDE